MFDCELYILEIRVYFNLIKLNYEVMTLIVVHVFQIDCELYCIV